MIPVSIPSPPREWSQIPVGEWLASAFSWWPEGWTFVIHLYALIIIVGIVAAVILTNARLTARGAEPWVILDVSVWAVLFGIVGSRLYHVVTHPADYFGATFADDPWAFVRVWDGGVAIFGAVLGGALGTAIACRITGLRFLSVADAIVPGLLLAQAIGRLGNYFNQELFGLPTDLPWGLEIDRPNAAIPVGIPDDALFHPTFLYESLWNLAGVIVLLLVDSRVRRTGDGRLVERHSFWQWGKLVGLYLVWYGAGRMVFESIRLDPSETLLGIRVNVWGAFAAVVIGLFIIIYQSRNHPGDEPSVYRPGRGWESDSVLNSDSVYGDQPEVDDLETEDAELVTSGSASER